MAGKHGLAIMIADKMPPPDKLKGKSGGDYSDNSDDAGDDEQMELDTMRDLRQCMKSGDDKGALGHLRDLVQMLQEPDEDKE
jgi:hypothetical protein